MKKSLTLSDVQKKKMSFSKQLQKQLNPKAHKQPSIQVTWVNPQGMQCKRIIEPNRCFCSHSFEHHQNVKTINTAYCLSQGCKCKCYQYIPYYDIKCMCRHSYKQHDINSRMCKMCKKCLGFITNWSCKCGFRYDLHQTIFQIKKNKIKTDRINYTCQKQNNLSNNLSKLVQIQDQSDHFCQSNVLAQNNFSLSDSRTVQFNKYLYNKSYVYSNFDTKSPTKKDQYRRKQIQRINQKYSNIAYQKQIDDHNNLQNSRICRPDHAREITPLQLLIRPHNYKPVNLQKFLQQQYRKYQEKLRVLNGGI